MSLQLIAGGSGSGKSYQLYQNLIHASIQSPETMFLVIVPEQFTMQTQRELVHMHPRKGLMNIDILSFQRLAHRIFEEVGADRRTVLEETGKTLLLRRAALKKQDELLVLKGNLKKQGYLSEIKSLISELTQYDVDEEKMDQMLEASKEKPQLYYKLKDIRLLYESFREELQGKYITAEETLDALCQVAEQSSILKNSVIALDGFTGFTPIQQKLLKKLMMLAKEIHVTVTIDAEEDFTRIKGEHELFYLSKKTIRSLMGMASETGCEILPPVLLGKQYCPRFQESPYLAFLEGHLFRENRSRTFEGEHAEPSAISLHTAGNPMEEIRLVGRKIRKLTQEGYRYQDMAVIVGDMASYKSYVPRVLGEYEIPCFVDHTRSLLDNPFVEFLRSALAMIQENYSITAVFRLLRTGLCGMERTDIDLLENYALAAGIKGLSKWKTQFKRQPKSILPDQLLRCEEYRSRFMEKLLPFTEILKSNQTTVREKCAAFYELITSFEIQNQLSLYEEKFQMEGRADLQKEYAQIYESVMELLDKMVELLGEETVTLKEYTELLEAGIEEERVGIIPPTMDQVQVGDLERTRLHDIQILFFVGLNDGWVPKSAARGGLLSDLERELLREAHVELAPTARQDSYIQKFYLYLNMTKPSRRLFLSYCKASMDGSVMRPSYVIRTVKRMFPQLSVTDEDQEKCLREYALSKKTGLDFLVDGLKEIKEKTADREWLELYNWYRGEESYRQTAEKLVQAAFLTFDEKGIGHAAARELYGEVLVNSVSRLEKFASCAFLHFLQYGLGLTEREEYAFHPVDLGNIVHQVVERLSEKVEKTSQGWRNLTDELREQFVDEAVEEVTGEYGGEILHSSARNEYMIARLRRILKRTAWAIHQQILSGHFYPVGYEVSFSQVSDLRAVNIALTGTEKMKLRGRIDRIDTCETDDQVYVKVVDYKSGNTGFDLVALYHGLQLQLVVYMNTALEMEKRVHPEKLVVPAGIFYYHVKDPLLDGKKSETPEEINRRILKELRMDGLVNGNPDIVGAMDSALLNGGSSGVIPVSVNKDGKLSKASKAVTGEQFEKLNAFVRKKVKEIGCRIMDGEIAPIPYERKQQTGCDYCPYRCVCGFDSKIPGTKRNRIADQSSEEIWKQMDEENKG